MDFSTSATQDSKPHPHIPWGWIVFWIGLIGLLIILAMGLFRSQEGTVGIGKIIPNFTLTTFDNEEIKLSDLRGKIVLINFWSSWCNPCEQEAPDLEEAWKGYETQGEVIMLGVDYVDTETEARQYLKKFGITYPNGPDLGTRISQVFRIRGVPETYVLDREGILQYIQIGPFLSLYQIKSVIDPMLSK